MISYQSESLSGVNFFEDSRGGVWFGDLSGVYRLKDGNATKFTAENGVPQNTLLRPFVEDADGGIWFASGWFGIRGIGLVGFYDEKFTIFGAEVGLSNLSVNRLFKDREGTIWASTDKGINHLSKPDEIVFYRIVQECLNNVIKHSEAKNVWLAVKLKTDLIEFVCRDDGKGFDFEAAKNSSKSGLELNGIAERVKILKGECKIESEVGKGTIVLVKIGKTSE